MFLARAGLLGKHAAGFGAIFEELEEGAEHLLALAWFAAAGLVASILQADIGRGE